jgi:hypothetical protein
MGIMSQIKSIACNGLQAVDNLAIATERLTSVAVTGSDAIALSAEKWKSEAQRELIAELETALNKLNDVIADPNVGQQYKDIAMAAAEEKKLALAELVNIKL